MNTNFGGAVAVGGNRSFQINRGGGGSNSKGGATQQLSLLALILAVLPWFGLPREVNLYRVRNFGNVMRGLSQIVWARVFRVGHSFGTLAITVTRGDGTVVDYGVVSYRVVTTAGVNKLVAGMNTSDATTFQNFKYHGFGTGTVAENVADTGLGTEFTTEYAVNNTRPTGSQTTGGSSNVYRSVATFTPDSGGVLPVTEHMVNSQAATGGGTCLDRSKFSAMNLDTANGDNMTATYDFTVPAGG